MADRATEHRATEHRATERAIEQRRAQTGDRTGRRALGQRGEDVAADHLAAAGYRIIDRNWRCREGEIDLVARAEVAGRSVIVFCEVKTRTGLGYGDPLEAITYQKARRLRRLAGLWLAAADRTADQVRVDAIGVVLRRGEQPRVTHVEGVDG